MSTVTTTTTTTPEPAALEQKDSYRLPDATTLQNISKIAISEDKPIMLDYWTAS